YGFARDVGPLATGLATFGLAFVLLIGLVLITRSGGLGPAMAFTRSKPKQRDRSARRVTFDDVAGLAETRPGIAFGLTVCMLSLLGFPLTFGFIGKWYIISAVVAQGQMILPVILVLTSVVSAAYYLPLIMAMYMRPAPSADHYASVRLAPAALGAIVLSVAAILLFGVWPGGVQDLATRSAETVTQTGLPMAERR
ncbi:MAG: hypothetical protein M3477_05125, partial [Gemmatimonadota bacterium]|nr:hypothetical protein [Gemmatimonadota bacterium]